MTWGTTEREDRKVTEATRVCRVFLDPRAQRESKELLG